MTPPVRRAGVLGHPVAHSLSPALHRAAYRELGLDWDYQAIDVTPDHLAEFLDSLDSRWVGLSLTMPLKEAVLPFLASIDDLARRLGVVNTVLLAPNGARHGANTDVPGLVQVLTEAEVAAGADVTLLGGGATARSTLAALGIHGAGRVTVCARRADAGRQLVDLGVELGLTVRARGFDEASEALAADLVVATVPAGATDGLAASVPARPGTLVEVVYDPWPTRLAAGWAAAGGSVVGGLELLVHQAHEQLWLMTGERVPTDLLRAAGSAALADRS
ncbi:MAG TPA: shikimate dehydrogenase [Actinomycetes bacterium]|nr:shikimate dehydrogenase [Actinomycetes bacterium]